jgi:hypothetical protein
MSVINCSGSIITFNTTVTHINCACRVCELCLLINSALCYIRRENFTTVHSRMKPFVISILWCWGCYTNKLINMNTNMNIYIYIYIYMLQINLTKRNESSKFRRKVGTWLLPLKLSDKCRPSNSSSRFLTVCRNGFCFLYSAYRGLYPRGQSRHSMKLLRKTYSEIGRLLISNSLPSKYLWFTPLEDFTFENETQIIIVQCCF